MKTNLCDIEEIFQRQAMDDEEHEFDRESKKGRNSHLRVAEISMQSDIKFLSRRS